MNRAILLISCQDRKGITAAVTGFIAVNKGNIIHADQHIDEESNTFFMRVEWSLDGFVIGKDKIAAAIEDLAQEFQMAWDLSVSDAPMRVAIFVGKRLHCLYDLLYRYKAGQLACVIPLIISNHPDAAPLAADFKIKFREFAMLRENKPDMEQLQVSILSEEKINCLVLARYQQVLSPTFVNLYKNRIINIHHSFLPAFAGKNPYRQAYQKGVKLIGATSHYVTETLDEGPIIEQDTVRISHRDSINDLMRKGEDLEKGVLSRALRWHLEKKILCYANKTVVFD